MPICSTDAVILGRKCLDCRCIGNICLAVLKTEYDDEPLSAAQRFFFFSDSIQKVIKSGYLRAIPHNSKCRYGERGAADAKPKAQIILDAAKVSAASGGNSEPKQGQRSQSARGFCPRSTMRVPQPDIIEHFGNADAVPQPSERCLSRKAGIVRYCLKCRASSTQKRGGSV